MNFFFSFVIPVYNSSKTIEDSIKSISNSTTSKNEIIIIDDKSKDKSIKKIQDIEKKISNSLVLKQNKFNLGPGFSRNKGINTAKGKYIIFLDSDDLIIKSSIKKIQKIIEKNKFPDVILGMFRKENYPFSNKVFFKQRFKTKFIDKKNFLNFLNYKNLILDECWPFIIKREYLLKKKILFPELRINEDQIFSNHLIFSSTKILLLKEFFYFHRNIKKSLSKNFGETRCVNYFSSIFFMLGVLKKKDFFNNRYLINVLDEIVKNFTYSYIISKKVNFKDIFSIYRKNKKISQKFNLEKIFKANTFINLLKNFKKREFDIYLQNFCEQIKIFFETKNISNHNIYLYCNTPIAYISKKILKKNNFKFKKIIDDNDLNRNRNYFKKTKHNNSVVIICNANIKTCKNIEKKLKEFEFKKIINFIG